MKSLGPAGRIARYFLHSKLTPLLIFASLLLGILAVLALPREEEPQIVVPVIDVFVQMPGATAKEVEERVTRPMEKLLWEIPGVEYIYSTSSPGFAMAVVRFYVGQDEEKSVVRLNQKLQGNFDMIPPGASPPLVKPRSIDDVPILALTLSSDRYNTVDLRKIAATLTTEIKQTPDVSEVKIIGGQRRILSVQLQSDKLESYQIAALQVLPAIGAANYQTRSGEFASGNKEYFVETSGFVTTPEDLGSLVVGSYQGHPVYLRNIARISDSSEEPSDYVFYWDRSQKNDDANAVTITVAKRKNKNAITVAESVLKRIERWQKDVIPPDVKVAITRHYGETAKEKSNELLFHMMIAVLSVTLLIAIALGRREAVIVAVAIPVTLALTLTVFYLYGYTLNRITLFALIFSIGILVDDAIVVVENIVRHGRLPANADRNFSDIAAEAVDEVGNPTILATVAVIAAILPMAFVGGLMGPYMRPIPIGASAAMVFSLIVAFVVTPWASVRLLKLGGMDHDSSEGKLTLLYRRIMNALIENERKRKLFILLLFGLLLVSMSLVYFKAVTVKMLPFDNKSEIQVIIDMPEGTTLEQTARATMHLASHLRSIPEVVNYQTYIGTAAPYNFNGLVRHYFLRRGANVADIQVNLLGKGDRSRQSHQIATAMRGPLQKIAALYNANIKIAEVPPGPPVLQTLVAEIYGPNYERQIQLAKKIQNIFQTTDGVVDVDSYVEEESSGYRFVIDKAKSTLLGINTQDIADTLKIGLTPRVAGLYHRIREPEDTNIIVEFPRAQRSSIENLLRFRVRSANGSLVPLSELGSLQSVRAEQSIYHKNLMPVVYVTGDVAGKEESPVYAIFKLKERISKEISTTEKINFEQYSTHQPLSTAVYSMKWDGEWHITYEVFRDLGLAFAIVLVLIYIIVVSWFQSFTVPFVIMAAIPFSLVGIFPGHALLGAFFTATSMIGFIAGAGIVVRNSIILVDFIELRLQQGMSLHDAVVDAGAVRFRPMALTAAAVIVGSAVILFDPIFQGLAVSLMAGEVASLLLSRMAVPVFCYILKRRQGPAQDSLVDLYQGEKNI